MIDKIRFLQISGNEVEDGNVEASLLELQEKLNEVVEAVNEINRREQTRNRATHKNVVKLGDAEIIHCNDCDGEGVQLCEATCGQRTGQEDW